VSNPFGWPADAGTHAKAMTDMWRSWTALSAPPAMPAGSDPLPLFGGIQVGDALKSMTEGPRLADAGAAEHRMARLTERWVEFQTASRAYEGVIAAAWLTANQSFAGRLQERLDGGDAMHPDDALKLWLQSANDTLLETQRSPSFLESQRRLLRCGIEFLLAQREVVENVVEPAGLPTRSEIDEVHRSIHELKRRLRRLERERCR
jgi:polyhydroxyalkanoate synthase subunit PhaE